MVNVNADNYSSIITECIDRQPKAQKKLFEILAPKMYAICVRYAKDSDDAKDLIQDGFIRLFKNIDKFENRGSFEGWAKRIFINTCIEYYRKQQKEQLKVEIENTPEFSIDSNALSLLKAADLMLIIQKLPMGYRTVFNLFAIEGYSHEEIAAQLGISINTSKSQLFKARQHLQEIILKQELQ
ncbi:MAG: RNA polymerase sigma factor [Bacteroidetes bacterium]|nr:RNA polymerase sigma factor [Bacteroidota bacterium]